MVTGPKRPEAAISASVSRSSPSTGLGITTSRSSGALYLWTDSRSSRNAGSAIR